MVNRAVALFLAALCITQVLHGGLSTPRLSSRSNQEGTSSSTDSGDGFASLLNQSSQIATTMEELNTTMQEITSFLDQAMAIIAKALQNSTRATTPTA